MQRRVTLDARLDDVEIGDFVGVEYLCDVAEGGLRVAVRDAAPLARRRDAHADPLGAPNRDEGLVSLPAGNGPDSRSDRHRPPSACWRRPGRTGRQDNPLAPGNSTPSKPVSV